MQLSVMAEPLKPQYEILKAKLRDDRQKAAAIREVRQKEIEEARKVKRKIRYATRKQMTRNISNVAQPQNTKSNCQSTNSIADQKRRTKRSDVDEIVQAKLIKRASTRGANRTVGTAVQARKKRKEKSGVLKNIREEWRGTILVRQRGKNRQGTVLIQLCHLSQRSGRKATRAVQIVQYKVRGKEKLGVWKKIGGRYEKGAKISYETD